MVRVIYLGLFFWYEEFSHSTVIPLSFRFLTNSPHSPLIPLSFPSFPSFPCHSPHSVSPHFPSHSPIIPQFIRFPLIPLSFHCHLVSPHSPVIPLIRFLKFPCHSPGFPLIRFPLLHTQFSHGCSLSALFLFPCSLSVLSRHSPVLWRSRTTSQIQGARGRRARP